MATPLNGKNASAARLGQRGGRSRASKLPPERRAAIARAAAQARWSGLTLGALKEIGDLPLRVRGFDGTVSVLAYDLVEAHPEHGRHVLLTLDMDELSAQMLAGIRGLMEQASARRENDYEFIRSRTGVYVNKTILCRGLALAHAAPVSIWTKLPVRMIESLVADVLRDGAGTSEANRLISAIKTTSEQVQQR